MTKVRITGALNRIFLSLLLHIEKSFLLQYMYRQEGLYRMVNSSLPSGEDYDKVKMHSGTGEPMSDSPAVHFYSNLLLDVFYCARLKPG